MLRYLFFSMISILFFSSCHYFGGHRIRGNGKIVNKERAISGFNEVKVSGAIVVYIRQDSALQSVKVETDENLQDFIEISEQNEVLFISVTDHYNPDPTGDVTVYVSAPTYRRLHVSGASKIVGENKISSPDAFKIEVQGASHVKLEINTPELKADLSGASSAELTGETKYLSLEGSGASGYKCFNLKAENTVVDISGASKAEVFASVKLDVKASGASDVLYKGGASLSKNLSGASNLQHVD